MKSWMQLFVIALIAVVAVGCAPASNSGGGEEAPAGDTPAESNESADASKEMEEAGEAMADAAEEVGEAAAAVVEEAAEEVAEAAEEMAEEAPAEGSAPEEAAAAGGDDLEAMMAGWAEAFGKLDIEAATAHYADDYEDAESGSKEEYLAWIGGIVDQGFLEGMSISTEDAEIEVDGDEATAGPYDIESDAGAWTLDVYLEKREGAWKIVSTDVY